MSKTGREKSLLSLYTEESDLQVTSTVTCKSPQLSQKERLERFLGRKISDMGKVFGKVPPEVPVDRRLLPLAKDVLALLAIKAIGTRFVSATFDDIADVAGCCRRQVVRAVNDLVARKYVRVAQKQHGRVNVYELLGPLFAVDGDKAPAAAPVAAKTAVCGACGRKCRAVARSGWCRTCSAASETLRKWESARRELGEGATDEQIASKLHIRKVTKRFLEQLGRMRAIELVARARKAAV